MVEPVLAVEPLVVLVGLAVVAEHNSVERVVSIVVAEHNSVERVVPIVVAERNSVERVVQAAAVHMSAEQVVLVGLIRQASVAAAVAALGYPLVASAQD